MRVANKIMYDMVKHNLANTSEELNRVNEMVVTGRRINDLSDDPVGLSQALNIKSSVSNIEQMGRNITMGRPWLTAAESSLSQVHDLITEAKTLSIQMATGTVPAFERAAAAVTVQNLLEEMLTLAYTEVNGRYVLAGTKTDTKPFYFADASGNAVSDPENATQVIYDGNDSPFTIKVGKDTTVEIGSDGEAVFQPSGAGADDDIFQTLIDLKTYLENDDIDGIQGQIPKLADCFDQFSTKISDVGSKMLRMEIKEKILQDLDLNYTDKLSSIEDADITEAVVDLKSRELAYQATLSSSAKVMELTLVNYI